MSQNTTDEWLGRAGGCHGAYHRQGVLGPVRGGVHSHRLFLAVVIVTSVVLIRRASDDEHILDQA